MCLRFKFCTHQRVCVLNILKKSNSSYHNVQSYTTSTVRPGWTGLIHEISRIPPIQPQDSGGQWHTSDGWGIVTRGAAKRCLYSTSFPLPSCTHASGLLGWLPSMSEKANIADQVCPCPSLLILETVSGGVVVVLSH